MGRLAPPEKYIRALIIPVAMSYRQQKEIAKKLDYNYFIPPESMRCIKHPESVFIVSKSRCRECVADVQRRGKTIHAGDPGYYRHQRIIVVTRPIPSDFYYVVKPYNKRPRNTELSTTTIGAVCV